MHRTLILAWDPITGSRQEVNTAPEHHPTSSTYFKLPYPVQPQEEPHLTEAGGTPGEAGDHKGLVGLCKAGEVQGIECLGKGKWISAPAGGRKGRRVGQQSFVFQRLPLRDQILLSVFVFRSRHPENSQRASQAAVKPQSKDKRAQKDGVGQ